MICICLTFFCTLGFGSQVEELDMQSLPHFSNFEEIHFFLSRTNADVIKNLKDQKNIVPSQEPVPDRIQVFFRKVISEVLHDDSRFQIALCKGCGSTSRKYTVWLDLDILYKNLTDIDSAELNSDIQYVIAHELSHIIQKMADQMLPSKVPEKLGLNKEDFDSYKNALRHAEVDLIAMKVLNLVGVPYPYGGASLLNLIMTMPPNADRYERFYISHDLSYRLSILQYSKTNLNWK